MQYLPEKDMSTTGKDEELISPAFYQQGDIY